MGRGKNETNNGFGWRVLSSIDQLGFDQRQEKARVRQLWAAIFTKRVSGSRKDRVGALWVEPIWEMQPIAVKNKHLRCMLFNMHSNCVMELSAFHPQFCNLRCTNYPLGWPQNRALRWKTIKRLDHASCNIMDAYRFLFVNQRQIHSSYKTFGTSPSCVHSHSSALKQSLVLASHTQLLHQPRG